MDYYFIVNFCVYMLFFNVDHDGVVEDDTNVLSDEPVCLSWV